MITQAPPITLPTNATSQHLDPLVTPSHTQPSWIELSASAFNNNASRYKQTIGTSILAPVIKANAYGHGIIEIGQLCEQNNNIDWICVVKLSEALMLRDHHVTKPILILGFLDDDPVKALCKNITYACSDYEQAAYFNNIGKKTNTLVSIHLKIDTGLSRFGRPSSEASAVIAQIQTLDFVRITGIWSHCAESHNEDRAYTRAQVAQFKNLVTTLTTQGIHIPLRHMGNSAATTTHELSFCNFFRVGLGMYGYWPSEFTKTVTQNLSPDFILQPIMQWKTRILYIKQVPAGTPIGYDRTVIAQKDTTIALLPVGYEDGYSPFLSNKGVVGIGNEYAAIVGRIAMNITTIDITHIPDAHVGQEVILLGNDPHYNAIALANTIQIHNPRFVTTSIKSSIPRIVTK